VVVGSVVGTAVVATDGGVAARVAVARAPVVGASVVVVVGGGMLVVAVPAAARAAATSEHAGPAAASDAGPAGGGSAGRSRGRARPYGTSHGRSTTDGWGGSSGAPQAGTVRCRPRSAGAVGVSPPTRDRRTGPSFGLDDLEVLEDGVPQKIDTFEEAVTPVSLVLAMDESGSMRRGSPPSTGTIQVSHPKLGSTTV